MSTNADLGHNIPLFQFPPSIESELEARGYVTFSSTHARMQPTEPHQPHLHFDRSGTFNAGRRSSTSILPTGRASARAHSHPFSELPLRHHSLSAADMHHLPGYAIARDASSPIHQARPPSALGASYYYSQPSQPNADDIPADRHSLCAFPVTQPAPRYASVARESSSPLMSAPLPLALSHGTRTHPPHYAYQYAYVHEDMADHTATSPPSGIFPAHDQNQDLRSPSAMTMYQSPSPVVSPEVQNDFHFVKHESMAEDEVMSWSTESVYASPDGTMSSCSESAQQSMEQIYDCKQEQYETSVQLPDGWDGTTNYDAQPHELYIDTSTIEYSLPYATDIFTDSPMSMHYPELHQSPSPSLHTIVPPPSSNTRSYTLEGAITPISPPSQSTTCVAPPPASSSAAASRTPGGRTGSPPPMESLRPATSRPSQPSAAKADLSSTSGTISAPSAQHPSVPPPGSTSTASAVQKRPRGRPRKNPPSARPPSPPPPVNYPFPQFPDPPPSSLMRFDASGSVSPIAGAAPVLTAGTAGTTGPLTGGKSSDHPFHVDSAGLGAGQGIFRLNLHREGGGEGGAGAGPDGKGEGEKKKPIMACLFCRERKIACGPPPPGGPKRCNQCTRRDLVCEYPKESRRGQHKRGPRAVRVEALASGSAAASAEIKPK
ncbi:hypothetical protein BD414DRAFT_455584, partial [Trametes punicea]